MSEIVRVDRAANGRFAPGLIDALERGDVLFLPGMPFEPAAVERALFSPAIVGTSKNVSFDPSTGRVGGTTARGGDAETIRAMLDRFSRFAADLAAALAPEYRDRLTTARASFRPIEIEGRATSWRKDDTRLHVDAFPASPVQGRRILRLFSNVNPAGRARVWRVGGRFEDVAARFAPHLRVPPAIAREALRLLRITKSRRTAYDALMLQLHDRMKADEAYQSGSPQTRVEFPAATTWLTFTDQVSHAAMSGQYQLEQTFLLPLDAMRDARSAPVRVLERLTGRADLLH